MNLFLGYYIPYRHAVPLWDLESDYYLHNFHVKAEKGSLYSMKTHQLAFGVNWHDEEEDVVNEEDLPTSLLAVASKRESPLPPRPPRTSAYIEKLYGLDEEESDEPLRIGNVRKRCNAQNEALSMWWKVAIQSYYQQRMWMHLGRSPSESLLPPQFERLYQPDKLAQFDRFFSRPWATPVRRSHSAQHSQSSRDEHDLGEYRRTISGRVAQNVERKEARDGRTGCAEESSLDEDRTISDYVDEYGFQPRINPSLKRFIKPHENRHLGLGSVSGRPVSPTLPQGTLSYSCRGFNDALFSICNLTF